MNVTENLPVLDSQNKIQLLEEFLCASGLCEKAQTMKSFVERGLSLLDLSRLLGLHVHEADDLLSLADAPSSFGDLIRAASLSATQAAILYRRYLGWMARASQQAADEAVEKILQHFDARRDFSDLRFMLDFFWNGDRPFMAQVSR